MKKLTLGLCMLAAVILLFSGCKFNDTSTPTNPSDPTPIKPPAGYSIGDVYPKTGTPQGIVVSVNYVDPAKGKIIALKKSTNYISWGPEGMSGSIAIDGKKNMEQIKALNSDFSRYPAFKACADMGDGWYLPSGEEIRTMASFAKEIDEGLEAHDGDPLKAQYWSSTELTPERAYVINVSYESDGSCVTSSPSVLKTNDSGYARAFKAF